MMANTGQTTHAEVNAIRHATPRPEELQIKKYESGGNGPFVLLVVDGLSFGRGPFGEAPGEVWNSSKIADIPTLRSLFADNPHTEIAASGPNVGLRMRPLDSGRFEVDPGDSNVGHVCIGAGRDVKSEAKIIDEAIADGSFHTNDVLNTAIDEMNQRDGKLHLMGLISDKGVHADIAHFRPMLERAKAKGVKDICIHAVTDGRDVDIKSAWRQNGSGYIQQLERMIDELGMRESTKIATVGGREYYMDRYEQHWDYMGLSYKAMRDGEAEFKVTSAPLAVKEAYERGVENDQQIPPTIITDGKGQPVGTVKDGDLFVHMNYRADRAIMAEEMWTRSDFPPEKFNRGAKPNIRFLPIMPYSESTTNPSIFKPDTVDETILSALSDAGMPVRQESCGYKFGHVTLFMRGKKKEPFPNESEFEMPAPFIASTALDEQPEMSVHALGRDVEDQIRSGQYGFMALNLANPDMVQHCGSMRAAVLALEHVDRRLQDIVKAVDEMNGTLIVVGDHGGQDRMYGYVPKKGSYTADVAHSDAMVPFIVRNNNPNIDVQVSPTQYTGENGLPNQGLGDVAPAILKMMHTAGIKVEIPESMKGPRRANLVSVTNTNIN